MDMQLPMQQPQPQMEAHMGMYVSMQQSEPFPEGHEETAQQRPRSYRRKSCNLSVPDDSECEQALRMIQGDDQEQSRVYTDWAIQRPRELASTQSGSRVLQEAMKRADGDQIISVLESMKGRVKDALLSPHEHHVLRMCIDLVQPQQLQFVVEELKADVVNFSRHRFGCRIMERLINTCPLQQTQEIIDEIVDSSSELCRHTYVNFVMQSALLHGSESQKTSVMDMLVNDVQRLARHRVASHVVRFALAGCGEEGQKRLTEALSEDPAELSDLTHHHCGSFVVRQMRRNMSLN